MFEQTIKRTTPPHSSVTATLSSHSTDIRIDIHEKSQNPNSQGLLQLKKAACYAITATGISTKAAIIVCTASIPLVVGTVVISSLINSEKYKNYIGELVNAFLGSLFCTAGLYTWHSMTAMGAVKASKILDNFQQVNKTVITVGKGAIYLLTAALLGRALLSKISDSDDSNKMNDDMPLSILPLTWSVVSSIGTLALPPLGVRYCIDLINLYQNRAQAAIKKMQ